MDIRMYFQRVREAESLIPTDIVLVMSLDTEDGGKAGRMSEVARHTAAQLIVNGRARLATDSEVTQFREEAEQRHAAAEQASRSQMQVAVLSDNELRALKSSLRLNRG